MRPVELAQSRTFPVPVPEAFERVLAAPLEQVFSRRYGALPPVRGVRDQDGAWGSVGQTRVILLGDGGSMRERLTALVSDTRFDYVVDDVTGPMRALVASLEGTWAFAPAGTGVRVTWSWTVHPRGRAGALAMPVFGRLWHGYARQGLEQIESLIV
jgi:hypothetical protein